MLSFGSFFLSFFFLPCLTRNRFAFIVPGLREGGGVFVVFFNDFSFLLKNVFLLFPPLQVYLFAE